MEQKDRILGWRGAVEDVISLPNLELLPTGWTTKLVSTSVQYQALAACIWIPTTT